MSIPCKRGGWLEVLVLNTKTLYLPVEMAALNADGLGGPGDVASIGRSEEHTSELQSH